MSSLFRKVISQGQAGDNHVVIEYIPKKFPVKMTKSASEFETSQKQNVSDFQMNDLMSEITGVADQRRQEIEVRIEEDILSKLKDIEEKAYQEAYDLGLVEGTEKAFSEKKNEIEKRLNDLDMVMSTIEHLVVELCKEKENQILKLINTIASKIAMFEIETRPEKIQNLVNQLIEEMQGEEKVKLRLAASDMEFLKQVRNKMGKNTESIKNIKFEEDDDIYPGGCIMESNFAAMDATIEMRVQRAWSAISERLPRVDDGRIEISEESLKSEEIEAVKEEKEVVAKSAESLGSHIEASDADNKVDEPEPDDNDSDNDSEES